MHTKAKHEICATGFRCFYRTPSFIRKALEDLVRDFSVLGKGAGAIQNWKYRLKRVTMGFERAPRVAKAVSRIAGRAPLRRSRAGPPK